MIICLSLSSIPKLRTPIMLIFSILDMFVNVFYLNTRRLQPNRVLRQGRSTASAGREAPGAREGSGWNPSSHTGFLPGQRATVGEGRPGAACGSQKHRPRDPTTVPTHRFPPPLPHGSRESLRPARTYAAGPGHAGKSEARDARAALASGSRTDLEVGCCVLWVERVLAPCCTERR